MIDHVGYPVTDLAKSRRFYEGALAPLGIGLIMTVSPEDKGSPGTALGFGADGNPFFWIGDDEKVGEGIHIAFQAKTRGAVDAFHAAAVASGGRDNGGPGLRPHYGPDYYAAFEFDPNGMNVEAVCRAPS